MKATQTVELSERTLGWLVDHAGLPEPSRRALRGLIRESALTGRAVSLGQIVRCCPDPSAPPGQQMPCYNAAGFIVNYSQSNVPFGNCFGGGAPPPAAAPPPPTAGPAPAPPTTFTQPPLDQFTSTGSYIPGAPDPTTGCYTNVDGVLSDCPGQAPAPSATGAPAPGAPPAAAPPPAGPPPQQTILDLTYKRPEEEANWTWVQGPFGMIRVPKNGAAAAPAPRARVPEPVASGVVDVSAADVSRLLDLLERSLEAMCSLGHRARRCGATDSDAERAAALSACLGALSAAAGPATQITATLCAAKSRGEGAVLTDRQLSALVSFEECLKAAGVLLPAGPSVWEALISVAIPAAGAVAVAL